jgi:carbon-monoxide dehydrogenase catalytic subunit
MAEEKKSVDQATLKMLEKARADNVSTAFDRAETMKPCPIGAEGSCCKNCAMGPCRVPAPKKKGETEAEKAKRRGVCGATAETISARNFVRMVAAGTSAHSDHARGVAEAFLATAKGQVPGFAIKDEQKLYQVALDLGVEIGDRSVKDIAVEVGEKCLAEFGRQHGELQFVKRAPLKRQELWRKLGIAPRGVDREVVELMHRTHMGVDQEYKDLILAGCRCSLADGWGGSMISTELQDILFGNPVPIAGKINLGVLKEDMVNLVMHGHEPLLPELLVVASQDPELQAYAKSKGAKGINLAGMCCSANEVMMRHGIPVAGNFLQQELAIVTGAVDAMVVDVQCEMQSLADVAKCYHTKVITTNARAKMEGAAHIEFDEHHGPEVAKKILREAIDNFPNRKGKPVLIPKETHEMVVGFSHETINYLLGGLFRSSYRPLNDNIINGRIRGVAAIVGCDNFKLNDDAHVIIARELIKNNILVLATGCAATGLGRAGLARPEAAQFCGESLAEVCETVGMPPVLHMGSCVDNSRILIAATEMVREGGLGDDISDLPAIGTAPLWMSEKAVAIGQYFVASGAQVVFQNLPTSGAKKFNSYLLNGIKNIFGAHWNVASEPLEIARLMIERIEAKRDALGINKKKERVLFDMEMRRDLGATKGIADAGCTGASHHAS